MSHPADAIHDLLAAIKDSDRALNGLLGDLLSSAGQLDGDTLLESLGKNEAMAQLDRALDAVTDSLNVAVASLRDAVGEVDRL